MKEKPERPFLQPNACSRCGAYDHLTETHDEVESRRLLLPADRYSASILLHSAREALLSSLAVMDRMIATLALRNPIEELTSKRKRKYTISDAERERRRQQGRKMGLATGERMLNRKDPPAQKPS